MKDCVCDLAVSKFNPASSKNLMTLLFLSKQKKANKSNSGVLSSCSNSTLSSSIRSNKSLQSLLNFPEGFLEVFFSAQYNTETKAISKTSKPKARKIDSTEAHLLFINSLKSMSRQTYGLFKTLALSEQRFRT